MYLILVLQSISLSYGSYTCITELILVLRILFLYFGSYTCLTDLILVLRSLFLYFGSYSCILDLILVLWILYLCYGAYSGTKVPVGTTQIPYTEVPIGTIGLILILQNLYLFYRYESTRRYYRDFTCTKVPVGFTEQIQRYP